MRITLEDHGNEHKEHIREVQYHEIIPMNHGRVQIVDLTCKLQLAVDASLCVNYEFSIRNLRVAIRDSRSIRHNSQVCLRTLGRRSDALFIVLDLRPELLEH
ncbi:hypothetical protein TorRG33x02_206020 [Trema orientale]|uniref:Uncharacterized protein n=1 Tax=Trema orientale TaxID=63057 RepID=A0A2P5EDM5_TREOI|nr:hypothetical protein TorRG33x02_206020 [Trema orientale]